MLLWITALAGLLLVFYVQHSLGHLARNPRRARLARLGLLAVGVVFGAVCALAYRPVADAHWAVFLIGLELVHLPAAFILTIKTLRLKGY